MSDCEKYQEMISALLDCELSPEETDELHAHLESCTECKTMYATFSALENALENDLVEPPAELADGIMFRIRNSAPAKKRDPRVWRYTAAAACIVIVAAAAVGSGLFSGAGSAAPDAPKMMMSADDTMESCTATTEEPAAAFEDSAQADAGAGAAASNFDINGVCDDSEYETPREPPVPEIGECDGGLGEGTELVMLLFQERRYRYSGHAESLPDGAEKADADKLLDPDGNAFLRQSSESGLFFRKNETLFVPDGSGEWDVYILDK